MRESAGVWVQVVSLHTLCPVGGATMGACEGECWGEGSGDLPAQYMQHNYETMLDMVVELHAPMICQCQFINCKLKV